MVSLQEAFVVLQPLAIFVIWLLAYAVFIFKFYKLVSRREMFTIGRKKNGRRSAIKYAIKYLFLFPLTLFVWFFVISTLLVVLSQVLTIGDIFMISMAVTVLIRITAYCNEDLSTELASLIPFALLAVFILDISKITAEGIFRVSQQVPGAFHILIYYFIFLVGLEVFLEISVYLRHKAEANR